MHQRDPDPEEFDRIRASQNPWHRSGEVPEVLAQRVERSLAGVLWMRLLEDDFRRYQVVLGPRQVGKTTLLHQTVRHLLGSGIEPRRVWWLRLDDPYLQSVQLGGLVRAAIRASGATAERPIYLMLDEVVYADQWDRWLKTFYDDRWPVQVAASSSAATTLRDRRAESGVGRWDLQHLTPYSLVEFMDLVHGGGQPATEIDREGTSAVGETLSETLSALDQGSLSSAESAAGRLVLTMLGGFPEVLAQWVRGPDDLQSLSEENAADRLGTYMLVSQRFLRSDAVVGSVYKDIPQAVGVRDPLSLERLLHVLAGQVTGLLNPSGICNDLGLTQPTFDRYLSYLESAFLVFTLPNYSGSEATVQRRGRKLYFVDGAVRNAVLQSGRSPWQDPAERGRLLENHVMSELRSLALQSGVRLYHWRAGKHEVDVIFDHPSDPLAFEIASSPSHTRSGLRELALRHGRFRGRCYLVAPQLPVMHPPADGVDPGTLPLDMFLLAVGTQAQQALRRSLLLP